MPPEPAELPPEVERLNAAIEWARATLAATQETLDQARAGEVEALAALAAARLTLAKLTAVREAMQAATVQPPQEP